MSKTSIFRTAGIIFGAVVLSRILFGTAPTPPPYHQYLVQGEVQRSTGGGKQNFLVTLVGKFSTPQRDTTIELVRANILYPSNISVIVTDTSGYFVLDLRTQDKADSLAIKVVAVDKPAYVGSFFFVPQAAVTLKGETQEESSGCNGCGTDIPKQSYTVGYQYALPRQIVTLPY